jgi:hypothetical protein
MDEGNPVVVQGKSTLTLLEKEVLRKLGNSYFVK